MVAIPEVAALLASLNSTRAIQSHWYNTSIEDRKVKPTEWGGQKPMPLKKTVNEKDEHTWQFFCPLVCHAGGGAFFVTGIPQK